MLAMIAMIIKLLIGGVISYILPSFAIKDIKETDHLKITSIGIFSTALFSISYQLDAGSPYVLSAGGLLFLGILSRALAGEMKNSEKILFYSSAIIGLFIGFGYIFQGIILSFLVYYITFNQSDLFSILVDKKDDEVDDGNINNKIM